MINLKHAVVSGLVLILALSQSACRKTEEPKKTDNAVNAPRPGDTATATTAPQASRPAGAKVKIAFSAPSADHGWTGAISVNAKKQAAKYDDVEFSLTQAANAADQVNQLNT